MILASSETVEFTPEQLHAIEDRAGESFLDAAAGSGKTSVLVERFVQSVLQDGIDVSAILTITFTDKAAAQMRDRIRGRLRELGAEDAARATERAYISTIHGFCARLLRAHALAAGLDPAFTVLDELEAGQLADAAFEAALAELADEATGAIELIAAYGAWDLRTAIQSGYAELRSRGEPRPRLPRLPPAPDLDAARRHLRQSAGRASLELAAVPEPSARVLEALERLERLGEVLREPAPWPGDLERLALPGGNGAALTTPECQAYGEALGRFRQASEHRWAAPAIGLLDRLLASFAERYEARKRERSGLDFEDLELLSRALLRPDDELRRRYRDRFERVMVDELQDTNAVQLELIELVSGDNLFTVGDAQQSIYGFRHADVELFEHRGARLAALDRRATLQTNFRSRREILEVINRVLEEALGERSMALVPGRQEEDVDPRVELLIADKAGEWSPEGPSAPWRVAEARALAGRIEELIATGTAAHEIVVLIRATTDMRAYERALEERGIATYTVGGRGYWSHPQVVDLVAYLRMLANPRDEQALYAVLGSPLVGASLDALVLLAAAARTQGRDPWWVLREPGDSLDELADADRRRLEAFVGWAAGEREAARRQSVEQLLDRVVEHTGYDLAMLAMPGGVRRLANARKLMRLGREYFTRRGPDLHGFVELVRLRAQSWRPDPDESEAPIESEALDAVRLMTIHRAKGLEFPVVCVADLGRSGRSSASVLRIDRDGRLGLRLARPGTGARESALAYDELGEEQRLRSAAEDRRLFYVAMTRAKERLILSGAARLEAWGAPGGGREPIAWLGPALVPDVSAGDGMSQGVRYSVVRPGDVEAPAAPAVRGGARPAATGATTSVATGGTTSSEDVACTQEARSSVTAISYTSLAAYQRCGYRFYVERVLGVPGPQSRTATRSGTASESDAATANAPAAPDEPTLSAAERGTLVHSLLERMDFRRPVVPSVAAIAAAAPRPPLPSELEDVAALLQRFAATELCARLGRATHAQREQRFNFLLRETLITGMFDVIASEPPDRTLIVDYKTDRLAGAEPAGVVAREYFTQQLVYALAALRAGAREVQVVHVFLETPEHPVIVTFTCERATELERMLSELTDGVLHGRSYPVTDTPHRAICQGCPAEGGLCSLPLAMTRRDSPERLF
jgi:ATP-dependent helicase/nuclease subunit A